MEKQSLKNHIKSLKKARDACSSQLDIGALTELNGVIAALEAFDDHRHNAEEAEALKLRFLQALAAFVSIGMNIRDWL
jgi:hypothetical protein